MLGESRAKLNRASPQTADGNIAVAEEILKAYNTSEKGFQNRATLIKMLIHFYMIGKKAAKRFGLRTHQKSMVVGCTILFESAAEIELRKKLPHVKEFFGGRNREMMCDSFQMARKWATDIQY